jgi:sulfur carrier protein
LKHLRETKRIKVNGQWVDVAAATLADLLAELDYADKVVATARNQQFVRATVRGDTPIDAADQIEILVPMQGG